MNEFQENLADTAERTLSERHMEAVRQQGGMFVEAVRVTRMPMLVTDATLPGNPIIFANRAFTKLSGYTHEELLGQDPHFMNGAETELAAVRQYEAAIRDNEDVTLEILQYRKDGAPFRTMLFASPLNDGQGRVTNHFLSYLDITRRYDAEEELRHLTCELEKRVAQRTQDLEAANEKLEATNEKLAAANDRLSRLIAEREMLLARSTTGPRTASR
jgi:PAS domain S-box-containing protein